MSENISAIIGGYIITKCIYKEHTFLNIYQEYVKDGKDHVSIVPVIIKSSIDNVAKNTFVCCDAKVFKNNIIVDRISTTIKRCFINMFSTCGVIQEGKIHDVKCEVNQDMPIDMNTKSIIYGYIESDYETVTLVPDHVIPENVVIS